MALKSIKVSSQMVIGITANTPDGQDARFLQTRNTDVLSIDSTRSKYKGRCGNQVLYRTANQVLAN